MFIWIPYDYKLFDTHIAHSCCQDLSKSMPIFVWCHAGLLNRFGLLKKLQTTSFTYWNHLFLVGTVWKYSFIRSEILTIQDFTKNQMKNSWAVVHSSFSEKSWSLKLQYEFIINSKGNAWGSLTHMIPKNFVDHYCLGTGFGFLKLLLFQALMQLWLAAQCCSLGIYAISKQVSLAAMKN